MARTRAPGSKQRTERFRSNPPTTVPRSSFDLSNAHKTTIDSGFLYPVFVEDALPGDTFNIAPSFFCRMATPLRPFMDGLHLDWHFFSVPFRLVMDDFKRMMGERINPDDHNDYTIPTLMSPDTTGWEVGGTADYLGFPTEIDNIKTSALYHRAVALCWNEHFRDANHQDTIPVPTGPGPDTDDMPHIRPNGELLFRRGKRKDYFTGALKEAQRGEAVLLPAGDTAPIVGFAPIAAGATGPTFTSTGGGATGNLDKETDGVNHPGAIGDLRWGNPDLVLSDTSNLQADLQNAIGGTINDMRQAVSLQRLFEKDSRGGGRYPDINLMHFGVETEDFRVQRPEILHVGSMQIGVTPVPQTSESSASSPLGDLAGYATGTHVGRGFVKSFREHCIVLGFVSVRADLSYQQGLNRRFTRSTRFEYFWPELQHMGEQALLSREIFADGTGDPTLQTGDFSVWGYQPRYEEYRYRQNMITGQFRSTYAQSLDSWHLGLHFTTRPVLNSDFIEERPHVDRVVAIADEPEFLLDCYFKFTAARPIGMYGTPGLPRF